MLDTVGNFVRMSIISTFDNLFVIPFGESNIGKYIGHTMSVNRYRKSKIIVSR